MQTHSLVFVFDRQDHPNLGPIARSCIETPPVYLGDINNTNSDFDYANMQREIPTTLLWKLLDDHAAHVWKSIPTQLTPFFEPVENSKRFRRRDSRNFTIDHIIPKVMGGLHHPRNYVLIAGAINSSWSTNLDTKTKVLGRHTMRAVHDLHVWSRDHPLVRAARKEAFNTLPRRENMKTRR